MIEEKPTWLRVQSLWGGGVFIRWMVNGRCNHAEHSDIDGLQYVLQTLSALSEGDVMYVPAHAEERLYEWA